MFYKFIYCSPKNCNFMLRKTKTCNLNKLLVDSWLFYHNRSVCQSRTLPDNRALHRDNRWSLSEVGPIRSWRSSTFPLDFWISNAIRNNFNTDIPSKNFINGFVMNMALLTTFYLIEDAHQRWQQSKSTWWNLSTMKKVKRIHWLKSW